LGASFAFINRQPSIVTSDAWDLFESDLDGLAILHYDERLSTHKPAKSASEKTKSRLKVAGPESEYESMSNSCASLTLMLWHLFRDHTIFVCTVVHEQPPPTESGCRCLRPKSALSWGTALLLLPIQISDNKSHQTLIRKFTKVLHDLPFLSLPPFSTPSPLAK
jgi:hypothetical protein